MLMFKAQERGFDERIFMEVLLSDLIRMEILSISIFRKMGKGFAAIDALV